MKRAKGTGKDGIDRWTNNGHGITVGKKPITKEQAAKIDAEVDKKQKKGK